MRIIEVGAATKTMPVIGFPVTFSASCLQVPYDVRTSSTGQAQHNTGVANHHDADATTHTGRGQAH